MHHPPRHRRKAWRRAEPSTPGFRPPWSVGRGNANKPSADLSRREKLWLGGLAVAAVIVFVLLAHYSASWSSKRHLEDFLHNLRVSYSLDDSQVAAIRSIENEYHGEGGIFYTPSRSYQEKVSHEIEISKQMSPENGARFLADLHSKAPLLKKKRH